MVTGTDTFKLYSMESGKFEAVLTQVSDKDREISTSYTCHEWLSDTNLIICTVNGEMIVLDNGGQFQGCVDLPAHCQGSIDCITATQSRGFIVSSNGMIIPFEKSDDDSELYRMVL